MTQVSKQQTFRIRLPQFEGPFDLLLFFIERDEIDIYDIPIAKITEDFLAYLRAMEELDIEVAGEFILMAAVLMRIKAKMLLPRPELDEEGNEIDPREELVHMLIEYKRFKELLPELRQLEQARAQQVERGNVEEDLLRIAQHALIQADYEPTSVYKLFAAFQRVVEKDRLRQQKPQHTLIRIPYTVKHTKAQLRQRFAHKPRAHFRELFHQCSDRLEAIVCDVPLLGIKSLTVCYLRRSKGQAYEKMGYCADLGICGNCAICRGTGDFSPATSPLSSQSLLRLTRGYHHPTGRRYRQKWHTDRARGEDPIHRPSKAYPSGGCRSAL